MKKAMLKTSIFLLMLGACGLASAQMELAQKSACMICHAVDKKVVGPAFQDIATRYSGQPGAADQLAATIIKGGSGHWGPAPMPPNAVSPEEAKQLATWVLSLKP